MFQTRRFTCRRMTLDSYLLSIFVFGKKFKRTYPAYCSPICARWNNGNSTLDATLTRRTQRNRPLTLLHGVHGRKYFQSSGVLRQLVEKCSIEQRDKYYCGKLKKTENIRSPRTCNNGNTPNSWIQKDITNRRAT